MFVDEIIPRNHHTTTVSFTTRWCSVVKVLKALSQLIGWLSSVRITLQWKSLKHQDCHHRYQHQQCWFTAMLQYHHHYWDWLKRLDWHACSDFLGETSLKTGLSLTRRHQENHQHHSHNHQRQLYDDHIKSAGFGEDGLIGWLWERLESLGDGKSETGTISQSYGFLIFQTPVSRPC